MKRNIFLSVAAAIMLCVAVCAGAFLGISANAQTREANKLSDFAENFESYQTDAFIENVPSFAEKWENNVLRGGEAQGMDSHLKEAAKVVYENGTDGNKVLEVKNMTGADTFFYIGPGNDFRVKNFDASLKVKFRTEGVAERSWVGFSFRKKTQTHYTGTNNLLFFVQRYKVNSEVSGHAMAIIGSGSPSDLKDMGLLYGDKLSLNTKNYKVPGLAAEKDSDFIEIKLEARGNNYKLYANDSVLIDCTFDVSLFDYFGKLSVNCCSANVLIDDVKVTVLDETLPPEILPLPSPEVTLDEAGKKISWERVEGSEGYVVKIGDREETVFGTSFDLSKLQAGTHEITVTAISGDTFENLNSAPSNKVTFTVNGEKTEKASGCGGSATAASVTGACVLLALASGVLALKRKKEKIK